MSAFDDDLNEIQHQCIRLLNLLNNRELGLYAWKILLVDEINELSSTLNRVRGITPRDPNNHAN